MKILILFLFLIPNAQASVMFIQQDTFKCSNGKDYDIARHYAGGWGPSSWKFVAICDAGTLKEKEYNGRVLDMKESHPDVAACIKAESDAIEACYQEFKGLNRLNGEGSLPKIVQGQKDKASEKSVRSEVRVGLDQSGSNSAAY